jgi:hypothetical protein
MSTDFDRSRTHNGLSAQEIVTGYTWLLFAATLLMSVAEHQEILLVRVLDQVMRFCFGGGIGFVMGIAAGRMGEFIKRHVSSHAWIGMPLGNALVGIGIFLFYCITAAVASVEQIVDVGVRLVLLGLIAAAASNILPRVVWSNPASLEEEK